MTELPRWAQELLDRHPGAEMPSRENPIPDWLAQETRRRPLWYIIRGAQSMPEQHPFLVHREIHRQPEQWQEILNERWPEIDELAKTLVDKGVKRIITTGCGSAFFTALHGATVFEQLAGIETRPIESFELTHYFPRVDPSATLVVGHSGTGGSIETVEAMEAARARGCHTLAMTNTDETPVGRASEHSLTFVTKQECAPCTSVVSTRILMQTMLAIKLGQHLGSAGSNAKQAEEALSIVPETGKSFLDASEGPIQDMAEQHKDLASWLLVGSGPNYFSAREGTLKIEEQAILVGKAYRTGDFHHDALSLVQPRHAVVAIEARGAANKRVVDVVNAANEGLSPTVAVTWSGTSGSEELASTANHHVELRPAVPEIVSPIAMTLVFQLLGYYLGVARGYNPDTLRTEHEPNARAWLTSFPLGTH